MQKFSVVSLFAGCGGMDLGVRGDFTFLNTHYKKGKSQILWSNDIDANACKTYTSYFKHEAVCADIRDVLAGKTSTPLPSSADIVIGGFPCQDFSLAGKRKGFTNEKRGLLYRSMVEVVKRLSPKVFIAENVKGLLSMGNGSAIKKIEEDFEKIGYHIRTKLYVTADFGVPQTRERVIIVGTKKEFLPPFEHPDPPFTKKDWVSLGLALGDLENIEEGAVHNHYWSKAKKNKGQGNSVVRKDRPGPTMRAEHHGNIEIHWNEKRRLSAREAARIQSFPDDFVFLPSTSAAYKQVGNAVAPVMAWHIARSIEKFLVKHLA